jgi:hypothetical protein
MSRRESLMSDVSLDITSPQPTGKITVSLGYFTIILYVCG